MFDNEENFYEFTDQNSYVNTEEKSEKSNYAQHIKDENSFNEIDKFLTPEMNSCSNSILGPRRSNFEYVN